MDLSTIEGIISKLVTIGTNDLPLIEKLVADIKAEFTTKLSAAPGTGIELGGLTFWRNFNKKILSRHLVYELTNTGKLTASEAQAMVDTGSTLVGPVPPLVTTGREGAATGQFSNIITWIEQNLPTLLQDFITIAPLIMTLIAAF